MDARLLRGLLRNLSGLSEMRLFEGDQCEIAGTLPKGQHRFVACLIRGYLVQIRCPRDASKTNIFLVTHRVLHPLMSVPNPLRCRRRLAAGVLKVHYDNQVIPTVLLEFAWLPSLYTDASAEAICSIERSPSASR